MAEPRYIKVFIGRFQPFHDGHLRTLKSAIQSSDLTVVVIGSALEFGTIKNPWSFQARRAMIWDSLTSEQKKRVVIAPQPDMPGKDKAWVKSVQSTVKSVCERIFPNDKFVTTLIGCYKGRDGYYLKLYKGWKLELVPTYSALNATDTRNMFFGALLDWEKNLPPATVAHLRAYNMYNFPQFVKLHNALMDQSRSAAKEKS